MASQDFCLEIERALAGVEKQILELRPPIDQSAHEYVNIYTPANERFREADVESQLSSPSTQASDDIPPKGDPFPQKHPSRIYRLLRWNFYSVYRRLFSLIFVANTAALFSILFSGMTMTPSISLSAVSVNLLVAIIVRQEHFVNSLFLLSCSLPLSAPLRLRRIVAKIHSYGGLHSGASVGAAAWYLAYVVLLALDLADQPRDIRAIEVVVAFVSYLILLLLVTIVVFAHPMLRARFHNSFEAVHKFVGWATVGFFWALVILSAYANRGVFSIDRALFITPAFWCLVIITLCIVYPWARLRRRTVRAEHLSDHAVRLHFDYTSATFCSTIRLSDNPLRETHAFACIPSPASTAINTKGFSVIVSNAGDWTSRLIANPPTSLYTKGTPTLGVLRVAVMFKRTVIIATGSGIAPCMSLFAGCPNLDCRVIWSTQTPLKTFNQEIIDSVYKADPNAIIVDTKKQGRPDLVRLAWQVYEESGAEAVFVISNSAVTKKVVYGLEARGVATFAPIFDS